MEKAGVSTLVSKPRVSHHSDRLKKPRNRDAIWKVEADFRRFAKGVEVEDKCSRYYRPRPHMHRAVENTLGEGHEKSVHIAQPQVLPFSP